MQQSNRAPSPFRAPSPYGPSSDAQYHPHHSLPTGPAQVGPGAITYKTSTGPDGRIIYEPYRAVAASYHTPSGVVSGIQWMKVDSPSVARPGDHPYANGVPGGQWAADGQVPSNHDWQRAEEKRRKHEEKAEAKRLQREMDGRNNPEYELQMARERDAQSTVNRDRRKSFNSGPQAGPAVAFPSMPMNGPYPALPSQIAGHGTSPYSDYANLHTSPSPSVYPSGMDGRTHSRNASASGAYGDLAKQFNDLDIDHQNDYERDRELSNLKRAHKYSTHEGPYERARTISGNYVDRNAYPAGGAYSTASGPYTNPNSSHSNPYPVNSYVTPSPNMPPGEIPYGAGTSGYPMANNSASAYSPPTNGTRSTTPFGNPPPQIYPRGHIWEGQPVISSVPSNPRSRGPSRAASPNPISKYGTNGKSPHIPTAVIPGEPQQLPAPEAFSRPINGSNSFLPFEMTKIQDMDEAYDMKLPKMPSILASHDIYPGDWKRCMQDLQRSWTGQLPVPNFGKEQPRRSTLAADLIDLWNASFFFNRGVEMILYKGRERRTGRQAGQIDHNLLDYEDDDYSSSSDSSTSDSQSEYNRAPGPYGRPSSNQMAELQEARRRRHEEKKERRRWRKEKKARRKAKARDKSYSVYITCLARAPPVPYVVGAQPVPGGYGIMPAAAGGYTPSGGYAAPATYTPGYGPPIGIPKTRSHGYGGDY